MRLVTALGVLGILLASAEVHAECGFPQWVGTATGTTIPTKGSLYIYNEAQDFRFDSYFSVDITWIGSQIGNSRLTPIADNVSRLDYEGPADAKLSIKLSYETFEYTLDDNWQAPEAAPRVLQSWHHTYQWTCSEADSLMLQLDQHTAAVRARWTFADKTTEWIVPARADGTKVVVELGKVNCGRTTLPPEQLLYGGKLELTAIRSDGSEVAVQGYPKRIKTADIPDDDRGLDHAFTIVDLNTPAAAPAPEAPSKWPAIVAVGLLLLGVLIGLGAKDQRVIVRGHGDDLA